MENRKQSISMTELGPVLDDTLKSGSKCKITVTGNSMSPLLIDRISKVVLVKPKEIKRGDMALYLRENGKYVLHRVVKRSQDGTFVMCGDAQTNLEYGIKNNQILGIVESFIRKEKSVKVNNILYGLWWRTHLLIRPVRRILNSVKIRIKRIR